MITKDDIFNGTNNGLDIIFHFYPQAREVHGTNKPKFRIRSTDDTPSASMKMYDGVWKVTDFGDDGRALNGIDICMREMDMKFSEAIYCLARIFNISGDVISPEINKAEVRKVAAAEDEPDGHFSFEKKDNLSDSELSILGPKIKQVNCDALGYFSLTSYSITKNRERITILSTDTYPIFIRECRFNDPSGKESRFYKIYQPLNPEKQYRFFYHGNKPAQYINGLLELQEEYAEYKLTQEKTEEYREAEKNKKPFYYEKLPEAVICSGERDALCVKALGYRPLWFNSESYNLSEKEYSAIILCVDKLYNIPDIDETGVKKGLQLAFKFINIHTIWLPEYLKTYRDRRGKPRKDFRDFCEIWPERNRFKGLLNMARPIQFWKYIESNKGQRRLDLVTDYILYFLRSKGFVTMEDKNAKTGYMFCHIQGNIVKEVLLKDIKTALKDFVANRSEPLEVREAVNNSARITESNLDLKEVVLNFDDYTPKSQMFFFPNAIWEVTANNIKESKPGFFENYVWNEEVIAHKVKRVDPAFKITKTVIESDEQTSLDWDIEINPNQTSNFLRFITNASRMFWRKELEYENDTPEDLVKYLSEHKFSINGSRLNEEEIKEQKLHLINKIFCLGYLLHRYKAKDKPWAVWAMDNKIDSSSEKSNGGSGKSCFMESPMLFMKSVRLPGRDPKMTENKHLFENITEHTDYILVDDAHQYLDFDFFYDKITGSLTVNPKFSKSYSIAFENSAKWGFTTNYTQRKDDPSTSRRMLYTVFSDYYHEKTQNNDYRETRVISDDFNKQLFREDYSDDDWNADINFFVDCCQFYLSVVDMGVKIQPPKSLVDFANANAGETAAIITAAMEDGFLPKFK